MGLGATVWTAILAGSAIACIFITLVGAWQGGSNVPTAKQSRANARFSFRDGRLVSVPGIVQDLLAKDMSWPEFASLLQPHFPDFDLEREAMADRSSAPKHQTYLNISLQVAQRNGEILVDLNAPNATALRLLFPAEQTVLSQNALHCLEGAPGPVWWLDASGKLIWANKAYTDLTRHADPNRPFMAPPQAKGADVPKTFRASVVDADGQDRWFNVTQTPLQVGQAFFATSIDALVEAEHAQRNFVQTLTKTFAHLPTGLVIFDRHQRLALFNPALVDLTALSATFLSARPDLFDFFDQLREAQMMVEPKDYATWRDQLQSLVKAARDDAYSETWTLSSGLTYRITGRPHPDGAVAFLLEDISAEVSLTRRFRQELGQSQSVIDALPDAIAVFSRMGILTLSNEAYRTCWGSDPSVSLQDTMLERECALWSNAAPDPTAWVDIEEGILTGIPQPGYSIPVHHKHWGATVCHVSTLGAGNTLVRFERLAAEKPQEVPQVPIAARQTRNALSVVD